MTSRARPGSGEMFDAIAHRYDLLNRVMSMGLDQRWRRQAVDAIRLDAGAIVLDLATGTGDLAIEILGRRPDVTVIGTDPSHRMLERARVKMARFGDRIRLAEGDAQAIGESDRSVDAVTMAFGIRNVEDRSKALREMARVTKDGGRIAILELAEPPKSALGGLARFHVHHVLPFLGAMLSRAKEYRYLQRSIAAFPEAQEFAQIMVEAGLDVIEVRPLTFGAVCLFVATPRRSPT